MINNTLVEQKIEESGYTVTQIWEDLDTFFVSYQTLVTRQNELPTNWDVLRLP